MQHQQGRSAALVDVVDLVTGEVGEAAGEQEQLGVDPIGSTGDHGRGLEEPGASRSAVRTIRAIGRAIMVTIVPVLRPRRLAATRGGAPNSVAVAGSGRPNSVSLVICAVSLNSTTIIAFSSSPPTRARKLKARRSVARERLFGRQALEDAEDVAVHHQ